MLTEQDYIDAAKILDVEVATIKAVAQVESANDGFLSTGEPVILFEAHIFSRATNNFYDLTYADISARVWNRGLYRRGKDEYLRLFKASILNYTAALEATSWGKFQIMGFNYMYAGYNAVKEFVLAMYKDDREHLIAFTNYCKSRSLGPHLKNHDWRKFARLYNGPGYEKNNYHKKLKMAYLEFR